VAKGLSLEQFKDILDTEAQKRCREQENTIKNLIGQNKRLIELVKDKEKELVQMQNRCYAMTRGAICIFCNCKDSCQVRNK
jgi:sensor histidine kinase YesM